MDWHSTRTFRRCARKEREQPVLYTNYLLRRFAQSLADCLRNSLMITSLALDGIPLPLKYLEILSDGLASNRNLQSLSLARCRIGNTGCNMVLEKLQHNLSLRMLNLSSCRLTDRSASMLSLFLKKRKTDLLQTALKESKVPRDGHPIAEEGLQVLILDGNCKFGDAGLRQLIRMLKNDFWLKKLYLRSCGISQRGGESVLGLLQTNSVLTHIDLRDNKVPADMLQIIRKFLKARKRKGERMPMKKRLFSCKRIAMISKNMFSQSELKKTKRSKHQADLQLKKQHGCTSQMWRRPGGKKSEPHNAVARNRTKWTNAFELKRCLSFVIESNRNLMSTLENSTEFFALERNRRLRAEEAYRKLQPRFKNLLNKIATQHSIHSKLIYENKVYANVQNVLNELKISMRDKMLKPDERSLSAKASEHEERSIVHKN